MDIKNLKEQFTNVQSINQIIEIKNIFIKKNITPLVKELNNEKDQKNKKELGIQLNSFKNEIEEVTREAISSFSFKKTHYLNSTIDKTSVVEFYNQGKKNILLTIIKEINYFFNKLDFNFIQGNEIVSLNENFFNLNFPNDHPSLNENETFYLTKDTVLRTHASATTFAEIYKNPDAKELKIMSLGSVFRRDEDDSTHTHQFKQLDFIWMKENLNIANLKWVIDSFLEFIFERKITSRYRLSNFPFTEPSFEVDVKCWNCKNDKKCKVCKESGWIEILGAGMVHRNILDKAGVDKKMECIAAGIGIERLAMIKYGVSDIRNFYLNDVDIFKQIKE